MNRFGVSALALAIGLVAGPQVWAQSRVAPTVVCRDGYVLAATNATAACSLHGGVDMQSTSRAQRGVYSNSGVYSNGGVYNPNGGVYNPNGGVYNPNGAGNRGVYEGGSTVYSNGTYGNRGVYDGGNIYSNSQTYPGNGRGVYDRVPANNGNSRWHKDHDRDHDSDRGHHKANDDHRYHRDNDRR